MHCTKALILLPALCWFTAAQAPRTGFSGASALEYAHKVVAFGPRPPGSPALKRLRAYLVAELQRLGCRVERDPFTASTPIGSLPMENVIARLPGTSRRVVAVSGHYDTKLLPGIRFIGANDGGSSTAFLLELARVLAARPRRHEILLVFFDGEEAIREWSSNDGLYGSRHLAERWSADGTLSRLRALINVDMIGDRDLGILREMNSTPWLRDLIWQTAAELGLGRYFLDQPAWVEDDHFPFLKRGASAVNLIDFDYGPGNSYWHTAQDTLDKLSPESFQIVGRVILRVLEKLD